MVTIRLPLMCWFALLAGCTDRAQDHRNDVTVDPPDYIQPVSEAEKQETLEQY